MPRVSEQLLLVELVSRLKGHKFLIAAESIVGTQGVSGKVEVRRSASKTYYPLQE